MKIYIKGSIYLEKADMHVLTIKFLEGDKILRTEKYVSKIFIKR